MPGKGMPKMGWWLGMVPVPSPHPAPCWDSQALSAQGSPSQGCGSSPSLLFQRPQLPVPGSAWSRWSIPSSAALQQLLEKRGTGKGAQGS